MMKKDLRFICYTYMREKSMKVDYEVLSDALTVSIGMVLPYLQLESEQEVKADLRRMYVSSKYFIFDFKWITFIVGTTIFGVSTVVLYVMFQIKEIEHFYTKLKSKLIKPH